LAFECTLNHCTFIHSFIHLRQILANFNNFYTAETGKKCTKQGMHLIIYYLESVANDVTNVSLFADDETETLQIQIL